MEKKIMNKKRLEKIGQRIEKIRGNRSKRSFGKQIGISGQYLASIEKGENCLSTEKLISLCENENISADYILFGEDIVNESLKDSISELIPNQLSDAFGVMEKVIDVIKNLDY
ncbi:MAG: helix-turn-helix transcriptional regulator [Clostridia bacterium]|nr:helix-turn-helix transcriptional regulator [Clostridia bacterium]